jgi:hypothetical protein
MGKAYRQGEANNPTYARKALLYSNPDSLGYQFASQWKCNHPEQLAQSSHSQPKKERPKGWK